jgi:hypothetical protein
MDTVRAVSSGVNMTAIPNDHKFHWLTGDVNFREYGGTWYRYDGDSCYTIVEANNMYWCCGDVSEGKYLVTINTIDMSSLSFSNVSSACHSIGEPVEEVMKNQLLLVEVCNSYGLSDRISHKFGNNFYALLKWAKNY